MIRITMENGKTIDLELDESAAPITVANFLKLVNEKFYDGLTFHRIIPGFMIQGGCPEAMFLVFGPILSRVQLVLFKVSIQSFLVLESDISNRFLVEKL